VLASFTGAAGEKSRDVLDQNPSSGPNKLIGDSGELEDEGGSLAGKPSSGAGDGEVLAGEASAEEVNTATRVGSSSVGAMSSLTFDPFALVFPSLRASTLSGDFSHVLEAGDSGPVSGEDPSPVGVGLALEHDADSRSLKAEVDASDAAEERSDIQAAAPSCWSSGWGSRSSSIVP
jgi:hypothetical protein